MSTTPGSIRKTLLTPCRRVGLSRKTKTPNSINTLLSQTVSNDTKLSDQQFNITPINKDKTSIKRKTLVELVNPLEKSCKLEDNVKSKAKKSLNECFDNKKELKSTIPTEHPDESKAKEIINKKTSKKCKKRIEDENIDKEYNENKSIKQIGSSCKKVIPKECNLSSKIEENSNEVVIETIAQIHVGSIKNGLNFYGLLPDHDYHKKVVSNEDTEIPDIKEISKEMIQCSELEDNNSSVSTSSSPIVRKCRKNRILSDSDDDFTVLSSDKSTLIERNQTISNEFVDRIRECEIGLSKLSEEDVEKIKNNSEKAEKYVKKKKFILSDDDDDFCPKSSMKIKKTKTSSNSTIVKVDSGLGDKKSKSKNSSKILISKLTSLDEEDEDAFTSTPDGEKNEKRELIDKIKDFESKIKIKKQKVDNLNRASVYKSKHNVDELKQLSETWRRGCVSGLNELLLKLQNQGPPIDMSTLLKNLRIPSEMVARIFVISN